jgi:hypothetical protein
MKKIPYQFILSFIAILLCLLWFIYPDRNLEPLIVLLLLAVSLTPLYWLEFGPWLDELRIRNCKFSILESKHKLNALEGDFEEFSNGVSLKLKRQKSRNYPTYVKIFFEQTDLRFIAYFKNGEKVDIRPKIEIGYDDGDQLRFPKQSNQYALVQFDIDNDGVDEILLCVIDADKFQKTMQVCVLKFHSPYFYPDVAREGNWHVFQDVIAYGVHQDKIFLDSGSITIKRDFRDFVYKWNFVDGSLLYTGTA